MGGVGGAALPVGDDAAGAAHDGHEGGDVPRVHDRVGGDVGAAGGEQEVAVAIGPGAEEADALGEGVEGGAVLEFGGVERVAGEQRGVGEAGAFAHADGGAVERGGGAVADHELVEDGLVDRAEDGLSVVKEGDERAPERDAGDEGFGAVDGIEDPGEFGVGVEAGEFFADDAVGREFFGDEIAEKLLGAAVGGGDGGGVGFEIDGEGGIEEVGAEEVAALEGEFGEKRAVGREVHTEG